MLRVVSLLLLVLAQSALALEPPPLRFADDALFEADFSVFPISSEMQMGKLESMLGKAPKGAVISVGGERSFRTAAMTPNPTYLLQLDVSEKIIRFNQINKQLLKAKDRKTYRFLRWHATFLEWKQFIDEAKKEKLTVSLNHTDYQWWQQHVRDLESMGYALPEQLNRNQSAPPCLSADNDFERQLDLATVLDYKSGHYLFYDNLYQKIHTLAKENKIFTVQINLTDNAQVEKLKAYLQSQQHPISVLDFDNMYYQDYMGTQAYQALIQALAPLCEDASMLLVMSNYKDYACGQFQFYFGLRMSKWRLLPKDFDMDDFILKLPPPVHDLIDGKLFEKTDAMPTV